MAEKTKTEEAGPKAVEAPKKKRTRKPIEIPDPETMEGPGKPQFEAVLAASKAFVESIKSANSVAPKDLNNVKRGVAMAVTQHLRALKRDPVEKRKAKLEAQIAKAQAALEALLKEGDSDDA